MILNANFHGEARIMNNIIINEDSLTGLPKLPSESIDLIFADPPYWMRTEGVLQRTEGTEFQGCKYKVD